MNVPNLFLLLDLDPDQPWDPLAFEQRLLQKRQEWSRLINLPTQRGIQAKQNLGRVDDLKRIAADESLRQMQAQEARQLRSKERDEELRQISERLELLELKGYLLEEELHRLAQEYAAVVSEDELRQRVKVPLQVAPPQAGARTPTLDPAKGRAIQERLQALGKKDLYEFLGKSRQTPRQELYRCAGECYEAANRKISRTQADILALELSGYCLDVFGSDQQLACYEETLRRQDYDALLVKVDQVAEVARRLDGRQVEQLLHLARQAGLDVNDALAFIQDHAACRGYAVLIPDNLVATIQALQPGPGVPIERRAAFQTQPQGQKPAVQPIPAQSAQGSSQQQAHVIVKDILSSRLLITYEITNHWWNGECYLRLVVDGAGMLPPLVLTAKQNGLPFTRDDGEVLIRLDPVAGGSSYQFQLPVTMTRQRVYTRLFLAQDNPVANVVIRHPRPEKLRLP